MKQAEYRSSFSLSTPAQLFLPSISQGCINHPGRNVSFYSFLKVKGK